LVVHAPFLPYLDSFCIPNYTTHSYHHTTHHCCGLRLYPTPLYKSAHCRLRTHALHTLTPALPPRAVTLLLLLLLLYFVGVVHSLLLLLCSHGGGAHTHTLPRCSLLLHLHPGWWWSTVVPPHTPRLPFPPLHIPLHVTPSRSTLPLNSTRVVPVVGVVTVVVVGVGVVPLRFPLCCTRCCWCTLDTVVAFGWSVDSVNFVDLPHTTVPAHVYTCPRSRSPTLRYMRAHSFAPSPLPAPLRTHAHCGLLPHH